MKSSDTIMPRNPSDVLSSLSHEAKVLFVRLRSLGDTILSIPLYAALKSWRPDLSISVLVEEPNEQVLANNPNIDHIISIRMAVRPRWKALLARLEALAIVRQNRFDCCINLHGGSTSAWLTALSGARCRVGYSGFRNAFAYDLRIGSTVTQLPGTKIHTVEHQIEWLRALGLPKGEIPPSQVFPNPQFEDVANNRLIRAGLNPGSRYAVVQPTSKFYTKEWTVDGFAEITDYLSSRYGLSVILTGGAGEEEKLKAVQEKSRSRPKVLASVTISELMWILRSASIFVGNDSGPTHLAAALSVPIVVLFGSSDSAVWAPWKAPCRIVQNQFDCNPCPGYRCLIYDEPRCILSITSSQVKAAIEAVLTGNLR
jgi:predicted lipopolysaccharide heptosyltransferase III